MRANIHKGTFVLTGGLHSALEYSSHLAYSKVRQKFYYRTEVERLAYFLSQGARAYFIENA